MHAKILPKCEKFFAPGIGQLPSPVMKDYRKFKNSIMC
jgi:hypothetical protein